MAKCYSTLLFNGTINVESPSLGFVALPPATGASTPKPLCEDINGASLCADASNTDACLGNELISGGTIPTSLCDNGLRDGAGKRAWTFASRGTSCNTTTHHCQ